MIALSIPVIVEKVAFSFGKVIVNSMSTIYTPLTVGALGISNNIGGFTTMPQNGFQEGRLCHYQPESGCRRTKTGFEGLPVRIGD